ncbi:uncharacterized protein METZ01_LOCUS281125, partial [marine metagenome]
RGSWRSSTLGLPGVATGASSSTPCHPWPGRPTAKKPSGSFAAFATV